MSVQEQTRIGGVLALAVILALVLARNRLGRLNAASWLVVLGAPGDGVGANAPIDLWYGDDYAGPLFPGLPTATRVVQPQASRGEPGSWGTIGGALALLGGLGYLVLPLLKKPEQNLPQGQPTIPKQTAGVGVYWASCR